MDKSLRPAGLFVLQNALLSASSIVSVSVQGDNTVDEGLICPLYTDAILNDDPSVPHSGLKVKDYSVRTAYSASPEKPLSWALLSSQTAEIR